MTVPFDVLQLPPAALERGGLEILRAGIIDGSLHVALRRTFDEPQAWGMALAEIARHVARIYAMETGTAEAVTLERIRNMLDAEFDAPSSAGTTQALK